MFFLLILRSKNGLIVFKFMLECFFIIIVLILDISNVYLFFNKIVEKLWMIVLLFFNNLNMDKINGLLFIFWYFFGVSLSLR